MEGEGAAPESQWAQPAASPAPPASPAPRAATDELRDRYRLPLSRAPGVPVSHRWTHPGVAANTPVGFGAEMGEVWMGASYQPRARRSDGHTGAVGAGFGLGDAERWLALQVGVSSFSTVSSGFGNRGGVDLHLHRALPAGFGVALGWESAYHWGGAKRDSGSNRYAVVSRSLSLRADPGAALGSATLSVGIGDGRFQSERAFAEGRDGWGVFGSASVRVAPPVSLIAEWTGQDVMLATSITPLREHRLAITGGLIDVTGAAGDGARFVVGASLAHEFGR